MMSVENGMRPVHPGEILREELDELGWHCQVNWLPRNQATLSSIQTRFHDPYFGAVSVYDALT